MNKIFIPLLFSLLIIACNNNKHEETITVTDKDGKEKVTIDPNGMKDAATTMLQRKEELAALTPLTQDEIKALVPERMMDAPLKDLDANAAMGATVAEANYKLNDTANLKLEIIDCAGPGGSGMFGMQYLQMINVNSDDEDEYIKTIDFNGGKAMENCKKKHNKCTLVYFSGNRFLVSLTGENIGIDALKEAAKGLDIK